VLYFEELEILNVAVTGFLSVQICVYFKCVCTISSSVVSHHLGGMKVRECYVNCILQEF